MKSLPLFLLLLVPYGATHAQQISTPEERIARILETGLYEGHHQKLFGGMGDAAAVDITKVVRDGTLTSGQMDCILLILNSAFVDSGAGEKRESGTALFVLEHLKLLTKDASVQARIDETRNYILGTAGAPARSATQK